MNLEKKTLSIDGEQIVCESSLHAKNAVILHGGGPSMLERYYSLAEQLINRGVGVILFGFSGHGESSGKLEDQSLERRVWQAREVIREIVPHGPLYLIGFSMGAQAVCDLLPELADRTESVLLACPAIYADSAHGLRFGNPQFTSILRTPGSWKISRAYENLRHFSGKAIIAIGSEDEVIPKGIIKLLQEAAQNPVYLEYPGATHKFADWLGAHPQELAELVKLL
ncbi:MAG TPA: alpha/beta fold hydrolase [Candidatus Saccharimonadales bacterium]|jgi:hypothetical protein|nr:alpha/beta fold hydrolase [Candidatus Saccharimonadales bacterium]